MRNTRDRADPLTRGYVEAIHAVNGEHPAEMRPFDPGGIEAGGRFEPARLVRVPNAQRLDRDGLIGRAASASYVPREGAAFEQLVRLLSDVWARHRDAAGLVTMRYETRLWLATRRD